MSRNTAVAPSRVVVGDVSELAERTGASPAYEQAKAYQRATVDAVVDSRAIVMDVSDDLDSRLQEPVTFVASPDGSQKVRLVINELAHRQIAERINIPFAYYERMLKGQPDLLAANVNRWLHAEPDRHMFRMLRGVTDADHRRLHEADAQFLVRAVRSPKYRPIDNASLLDVALPIIEQHQARLTTFSLTETRFHIRFVTQGLDLEEARQRLARQGRGGFDQPFRSGEIVGFGVSISNSEVGLGRWLVEPFATIIRCTNGMIIAETRGGVHLGADKDDGYLSDDTRRLEDAGVLLRVRDKVIETFLPETQMRTAAAIDAGTRNALELPKGLPMIEFIGNVGRKFELSDAEIAVLQEETVNDLASAKYERGFNQFTVSQGFTAAAKRAETFERRVELERIGWQVLSDPLQQLLAAGQKAREQKARKARSN